MVAGKVEGMNNEVSLEQLLLLLAISLRLTEGRSSNRIIYATHRDPWKKRKVARTVCWNYYTGYVPLKSSILHAWMPLSG